MRLNSLKHIEDMRNRKDNNYQFLILSLTLFIGTIFFSIFLMNTEQQKRDEKLASFPSTKKDQKARFESRRIASEKLTNEEVEFLTNCRQLLPQSGTFVHCFERLKNSNKCNVLKKSAEKICSCLFDKHKRVIQLNRPEQGIIIWKILIQLYDPKKSDSEREILLQSNYNINQTDDQFYDQCESGLF